MKAGEVKTGGKLTGEFAQELEKLVKNYLDIGAWEGAIAAHLEGMSERVRWGEFRKEVKPWQLQR